MVQGKLKVVRSMYDAFSRGDFEAVGTHIHPEAELRPALEPLEYPGVMRGRAAITEFLQSLSLWDSREVEFEEVIETGRHLVAVERWRVSGRDRIELDFRIVDVYTFLDGLIVRVDGFRDKAEAFEVVGLSE